MSQPAQQSRRPDLTDGLLAIYHVEPKETGKKSFYEIYDGPPENRTKVKMFPDIIGTELDINLVRDIYNGESPRIKGYKRGSREPYNAFVCVRRIKSKTFEKEDGGIGEDHTVELGIAFPKETFKTGSGAKELIGYRLWTGPGEPPVDFFGTAGSKKQVRLTPKDCFTLYDGKVLEIKNHRVQMLKVVESMHEGRPIRLARVSATVINRQRGVAPEVEDQDENQTPEDSVKV